MKLGIFGGGHQTPGTTPAYQAGMAAASRGQAVAEQSMHDLDGVVGRTQDRTDHLNQQLRDMARGGQPSTSGPSVDDELARLKAEMGLGPATGHNDNVVTTGTPNSYGGGPIQGHPDGSGQVIHGNNNTLITQGGGPYGSHNTVSSGDGPHGRHNVVQTGGLTVSSGSGSLNTASCLTWEE